MDERYLRPFKNPNKFQEDRSVLLQVLRGIVPRGLGRSRSTSPRSCHLLLQGLSTGRTMPTPHAPPPSVVLRNGPMSATVFLPGKDAYYRSSRFDHGSMVGDLTL